MRNPQPEMHIERVLLQRALCAFGPHELQYVDIEIVAGAIDCLYDGGGATASERAEAINLTGYLMMPGLINAHDHLQFALYPRLANPPYRNYIEWGEDIHQRHADVIARQHRIHKDVRLWWGGVRNLLCGVTTVCHHDPPWPVLQQAEFPVRVLQHYGWAHSVGLESDIRRAYSQTPENQPFIVHTCEGVDDIAQKELATLDVMEALHDNTILVHGLALDEQGIARVRDSGASLVVCPSSNHNIFGVLPDMGRLRHIERVALGNDSPLTSEGELLDEIRFAIRYGGIGAEDAYRMVTEAPAKMLRLPYGAGAITREGKADLIGVRDTGEDAAERLKTLSMEDIELVIIGGRVQLCSDAMWERMPLRLCEGLAPISVGGIVRWLRAPVGELLRSAEEVLGLGKASLSGKQLAVPSAVRI
ncbi:amidohydrolase family protein [Granulicella sp. 5B5]|uniref:amidohydrolase family protein n=1 Tax=Granulicella sp. 5B5 TaxID=1617967 RepID=UPI0015F373D4|nr:amidohydrolase family protein [Granulicella sp. 5B5]QMV20007.1 amidohydrolase family protein [Granulicella sp. 5B5]